VPAPILRRLPFQPALHHDQRQKLENEIYKDVREKSSRDWRSERFLWPRLQIVREDS
jgi:hypothetical protein